MDKKLKVSIFITILFFITMSVFSIGLFVNKNSISFKTENWKLKYAKLQKHLGRDSLIGSAELKNVEFENGIIEVDISVDGRRSYPGIFFRKGSKGNYERFYIRPHRAGLYPDALQYMPMVNGSETWQLYSGKDYTAGAVIPVNKWIKLKMEISGSQARVFWDNSKIPDLVINNLKHGYSKGSIGLIGPKNGTAHFSNFSYTKKDDLKFEELKKLKPVDGVIMDWEISKTIPADRLNIKKLSYPQFQTIFYAGWKKVNPESSGLVNVTKYNKKNRGKKDLILAKYVFQSDKKEEVRLDFGYSDEIKVFFNSRNVFYGNNAYQFRDPSFVGIIGYHDSLYLTVEKGLNEILFIIKDLRGGWGFMARSNKKLVSPKIIENYTKKIWETDKVLITPESVRYDKKRDILYVSNYDIKGTDFRNTDVKKYTGFISKVKTNGVIEKLKWVTNLKAPTGIGIFENCLYTTERGALVKIDIKTGKVLKRYPVPSSQFLNGLAIAKNGDIYMTDTSGSTPLKSRIYKFTKGKVELWMENYDLNKPNCAFIKDGLLYIGNSFDGGFKAIDLKTRKINVIARMGAGVIDGIRIDNRGNYIVSHWRGQLYKITKEGEMARILDTQKLGQNMAGIEYIKSKNLLIIPTFMGNRLVAYKLGE